MARFKRRVAEQFFRIGNQNHAQTARAETNVQLAGDGEAIAAVIAFAAYYDNPLFGDGSEMPGDILDHAMCGVFHEDNAGHARFDSGAINLRHFAPV